MRTSISDLDQYREICQKAADDDTVFATFKRHPAYNFALEHVPVEQGNAYLQVIQQRNGVLIKDFDKFRENDSIGSPRTFNFGPSGVFSPTTLRYIKVLGDMIGLFGDLTGFRIAEIGAGYGGQCNVISKRCRFASYTQVDLTECAKLQAKFLKAAGVPNTRCLDIDGVRELDEDFDLVISNYAFTECSREIQRLYLDKIIKRSKRGYITCNFISREFGVSSMSKEELMAELPGSKAYQEVPLTANGNFILSW